MNFTSSHKTNAFKRKRLNKPGKYTSQQSTLNHDLFIKKDTESFKVAYEAPRKIEDLPVNNSIIQNLIKRGYTHPTQIQNETITPILEGRDVLGIAQTGTGKTGAFLIPIINQLLTQKPSFQVLIVVPTRELAVQVNQEFGSIANRLNLSSICLIGGTSVSTDRTRLRQGAHVIIGTPGRLLDLSRQHALPFHQFGILVLDEFDRLLDMGFANDIQQIVNGMKNRKQTILFSATEEKSQQNQIMKLLTNPAYVRVNSGNKAADRIEQDIVRLQGGECRYNKLATMVRDESFQKVLVFAETKRTVSKVRKNLHHAGIKVDEIHGNKSQNYRLKALRDFRTGKIQVLIATDVAARGLDITEVTHVINFQPPKTYDSYIHRIGRTGRAGKAGKAFTFIN